MFPPLLFTTPQLEKEAEASAKAAEMAMGGTLGRPGSAAAGRAGSTMAVGSGAAAVRARSAKAALGASGAVGGMQSGPLNPMSSNLPASSGRGYSIASFAGHGDGAASVVSRSMSMGGSQLGMSTSYSMAGGGPSRMNMNVNHPPNVYKTSFALPGLPPPAPGALGPGGWPASSSGGGVGRSGVAMAGGGSVRGSVAGGINASSRK